MTQNSKNFLTVLIIVLLLGAAAVFLKLNEDKAPNGSTNENIRVTQPRAGDTVFSPLVIRGEARGTWFFEATFPVELVDAEGTTIAQYYAEAESNWMTNDFVPFRSTVQFTVNARTHATLILSEDDPSGQGNVEQVRIPVILETTSGPPTPVPAPPAPPSNNTRSVKLFYYNPEKDRDSSRNLLCSLQGLESVERKIPLTNTPITDTIRLFLKGELTSAEKQRGITTEFPLAGFLLKSASLNKATGVLTLKFDDPQGKTGGGSCRAGILWAQIEATAQQFSEVMSVIFMPEDLFQP